MELTKTIPTATPVSPLWQGAGEPPAGSVAFSLAGGSARVYERASDVDPAIWTSAFGEEHKDFEYYRLVEETMRVGFTYRYLVVFDHALNPVALQPLILVDQDLAASTRPPLSRVIAWLRRWFPGLLRSKMLLAGCLMGEAPLGLIAPADAGRAAALLAKALMQYAESQRIGLVTIKDTPARGRSEWQPFVRQGFTRLDAFPPMQLDLNFTSFDDYMAKCLSRITRKGLRRKLRAAASTNPPLTLEVLEDCSAVIDEIYPLYLDVARRSPVEFEIFSRDYFLEAGRRMPGRFRYFLWRQSGKIVAFSFCMVWKQTLFDNDIGLDYTVAHDLHLYSVTYRDLITWALANGFKYYRSGPFNYEPKLHLRLRVDPADIYVRHRSPLLNQIIRRVAPWFAPVKHDPALRDHLRRSKKQDVIPAAPDQSMDHSDLGDNLGHGLRDPA